MTTGALTPASTTPLARDAVASAAPVGAGGAPRRTFRRDVEGLRAIAVLAVLAYHAGIPGFAGGYVGVDVFFVLSGFLITSLLVEERVGSGGISLRRFYARRARRLLPAATLVLVVTLAAAAVVGGPLEVHRLGADGRATSLFGANLRFAGEETGYFANDSPSAFQHYWSLAVEEQFYFLWPALCLLLGLGARRDGVRRRMLRFLLVLIPASFALSVVLTRTSQPDAFFLLPTRAWELGIGALLALLPLLIGRRWVLPASIAGAAMVVGAIAFFDESTAFPGWAAALPVLGTALLLLVGASAPESPISRVLSARMLQPIGRYSYSLYLWHWPVLIVAAMAKPRVLDSWPKGALVVAASVPIAIAAFHLVEDPLRRSRFLATVPRRSLLLGAGLVVVAFGASAAASALPRLDSGRTVAADAGPVDVVPSNLEPPLIDAHDDVSPIYEETDCDTDLLTPQVRPCWFGDRSSDTTVALVGDSHAGMWFSPVRELAEARRWELEVHVTGGCTILGYDFRRDCTEWREGVLDRLVEQQPDAVILVDYGRLSADRGIDQEGWRDATRRTLERLGDLHVVLLGESPRPASSAARCLSKHLDDVRPCEPDPDDEVHRWFVRTGAQLARQADAAFFDLTPLLCTADRCPVVVGNRLVYHDSNHVTETFVRSVRGRFQASLDRALALPR